ncbi:MAG: hypothetical protein P9L98_04715 [Candidatus Kaelpia imicola]|nr:hypothetical protein [Candidatus Kaelpia imicola]
MKKTHIVLIIAILFNISSFAPGETQKRKEIIGGMCEYRLYSGKIRVLDIKKTERSKLQARMYGGPEYEGYEINYNFISDETIEEGFAREWIEREQIFRFFNSWLPSEKYIVTHDIEVGRIYPAEMMVIQKGTCTPVLVEIEGWERNISY